MSCFSPCARLHQCARAAARTRAHVGQREGGAVRQLEVMSDFDAQVQVLRKLGPEGVAVDGGLLTEAVNQVPRRLAVRPAPATRASRQASSATAVTRAGGPRRRPGRHVPRQRPRTACLHRSSPRR